MWGTRFCAGDGGCYQQIPLGNDRKNSKGKCKSKSEGNGKGNGKGNGFCFLIGCC